MEDGLVSPRETYGVSTWAGVGMQGWWVRSPLALGGEKVRMAISADPREQ